MDKTMFGLRLGQLRTLKEKSAREMSLALDQSPSYINRIENGKGYPSMQLFFKMCEYLEITPSEFFDINLSDPILVRRLNGYIPHLSSEELKVVLQLCEMIQNNVTNNSENK